MHKNIKLYKMLVHFITRMIIKEKEKA